MDGAPAGLCAPARIGEIMLVGMSKHKCGAGVAYTQSSGCRASMLGMIGKDPSGCARRGRRWSQRSPNADLGRVGCDVS